MEEYAGATMLSGQVKSVIYRNEENGYTVLELVDASGGEITAVGAMPLAGVGERVELTGEYVEHRTYGMQFRATACKTLAPATLGALVEYLSSGLIRGVGESTAKNIVSMFGMDTLDVLENHPERLTMVPGIGSIKANQIAASYGMQRDMRDIMLALQGYGITVIQAMKLYRIYGPLCLAKIQENPYRLIEDVESIGFKTADKIAQNAGIAADSPFRMQAGVKYTLQWALREGHTCLPREKLAEVAAEVLGAELRPVEQALEELVVRGELEYKLVGGADVVSLPHIYRMEQYVAAKLRLLNQPPGGNLLAGAPVSTAELERQLGLELAPQQRRAVELALSSGISVITGGPGTGKTTILRFIISIMQQMGLEYELCAPTGRAAKRMGEATGCEARTIHRMLEYGFGESSFLRNEDNPLEADTIIVDEMSMVDVPLMHALLRAVPAGARLVLVGDADQLPSVGPGNVLRDIIASGSVPVVRLNEVFRQHERGMIVANAHLINSGKPPVLSGGEDFCFEQVDGAEAVIRRVVALCSGRVGRLGTQDPLKDVQVLAPMKKGPLGVASLNQRLQAALNPPMRKKAERKFRETVFREGDKVMQVKNNYRIEWARSIRGKVMEAGSGVFNGDLGTIMKIDLEQQQIEVCFDDERVAEYDFSMLEELELAYCISIHKSQGSEFPIVLLPLLGGPPVLMNRNLLYTAVTRARKQVYILGHRGTVSAMARNQQVKRRYSMLGGLLGQPAAMGAGWES